MAAMPRSVLFPLLLLVLLSISTAHAGRRSTAAAAAPGPNDASLSSVSPRQAALTSFENLVKEGQAVIVEAGREIADSKDASEAVKNCLAKMEGNTKGYVEPLSKLAPEQDDAKFGEARDTLKSMLSIPSDSGAVCNDEAINTKPVVREVYDFEDMLQATLDLMEVAQPSPPPPAEDDSDEDSDEDSNEGDAPAA